jgi:(1->4)-alpha-D-glucan 1-alpha-D-glucosylmutase
MSPELLATYRIQFHTGFGLDAAAAIMGYLADLGVSHLYASPYLQAASRSTHGYDIVDHQRVNEELGGSEGQARLCQALLSHTLGQILDIVPNHMATATPPCPPLSKGGMPGGYYNAWWWDVLENGAASRYASYFDIYCWGRPGVGTSRQSGAVPLLFLGDHYGRVLEQGQLRLECQGSTFTVRYFGHLLPLEPRALRGLLAAAAERCGSDQLAFIADSLGHLPSPTHPILALGGPNEAESLVYRRHRDKEVLYDLLAGLCEDEPEVATAVDAVVAEVNSDPGALDAILRSQNYRLGYWRTARHELGYRCFFGLNNLIGLRVEDERVFADTHQLILDWLAKGLLQGLRIDHIDGLRDPEGYLQRLRQVAPEVWVVVEKILASGEPLRDSWPVAGTTGYEFLNLVGGLFVDPAGEKALTDLYADFTSEPTDYNVILREKKLLAMREVLTSDLNHLAGLVSDICGRHWRYRDYTLQEVREMLQETIACFPVYRTYVRADTLSPAQLLGKEGGGGKVTPEDICYVNQAIEAGKANRPDLDGDLFDFLRDILLLRIAGGDPANSAEAELALRFQQVTGPAMAKGAEDTACYCFNRLVSLNEVGGDPGRFGVSPEEFHRGCADSWSRWPRAMLATSTHDTKRSEDVRARISRLSEVPQRWGEAVRRWSRLNEKHRSGSLPDRNAEYLLYQTLVGAWPLSLERALA